MFTAALLLVTWSCHRICICVTIEAMFAIAVWLCDILIRDQDHCDGSNSVVSALESTQPCDLVTLCTMMRTVMIMSWIQCYPDSVSAARLGGPNVLFTNIVY